MSEKVLGRVDWFSPDRGYGFVIKEEDPEQVNYFVHFSYIQMEGYKTLKPNQLVSFMPMDTDKGPQAHDVVAVEE